MILALCILLTMASAAWANSIGNTSDAAVTTGTGYLKKIIVHTDATKACTLAVYDNTAASGRKLLSSWLVTTSATDRNQSISFDGHDNPYATGIYVDITCEGTCTYDVYFESR
jgi:hypothetical protein